MIRAAVYELTNPEALRLYEAARKREKRVGLTAALAQQREKKDN